MQLAPEFDDQVSVALCPTVMVAGLAVSDAVGAGSSDPPPPPQPASTLPSAENAIRVRHLAAIDACAFTSRVLSRLIPRRMHRVETAECSERSRWFKAW